MSKKKGRKKEKPNERDKKDLGPGMNPPFPDPRVTEKAISDVSRLLEGREFESVEEANAFLEGLLEEGPPPPSKPNTPLEKAQDLVYEALNHDRSNTRGCGRRPRVGCTIL